MSRPRTVYVFLVLIVSSWVLEFAIGIPFIQLYWGVVWYSWGELGGFSLAQGIAAMGDWLDHRLGWTAGNVLQAMIIASVVFHVLYALWAGLLLPAWERWKLGVRRPSKREQEQFNVAYRSLRRRASQVAAPRRWRVVDGLGLQMRWIGYVLVIDRELLGHRYFPALLAHELGHVNSEDRLAHRLYAMLPRPMGIIILAGGFPLSIGHILLFPLWAWYWKERVYAADTYAVQLGQGYALLQALDRVYLRLDQATSGGRLVKPVPYIEQRIDRICQLLARTREAGSGPRVI